MTVHVSTEVSELHGANMLEAVTLTSSGNAAQRADCRGLFCFIGAQPAAEWLSGVAVDGNGFILTDRDIPANELGVTWELLGRPPLPFETNLPGVFAAGDVRFGSMKRVAAAVGEGASVIRSVHLSLQPASGAGRGL